MPAERGTTLIRRRTKLGRPSRANALRRRQELLDRALDLFLEHGYGQTTIESIASAVGMSKRTLYAQYEDKAALFKAAVQRAIEEVMVEQAALRDLDTGDLAGTLTAVAHMRIGQVMTTPGLKLQRIVNAESYRFPEIFSMASRQITGPVVEFVSEVLQRHAADGGIVVPRPELAATSFMSMVAGAPSRVLASGNQLESSEIEDRIAFSVSLFLDGVRRR
jgi:AcrR family transcriptional regulator